MIYILWCNTRTQRWSIGSHCPGVGTCGINTHALLGFHISQKCFLKPARCAVVCPCVPLCAVVCRGVPWCAMVFPGVPWCAGPAVTAAHRSLSIPRVPPHKDHEHKWLKAHLSIYTMCHGFKLEGGETESTWLLQQIDTMFLSTPRRPSSRHSSFCPLFRSFIQRVPVSLVSGPVVKREEWETRWGEENGGEDKLSLSRHRLTINTGESF